MLYSSATQFHNDRLYSNIKSISHGELTIQHENRLLHIIHFTQSHIAQTSELQCYPSATVQPKEHQTVAIQTVQMDINKMFTIIIRIPSESI